MNKPRAGGTDASDVSVDVATVDHMFPEISGPAAQHDWRSRMATVVEPPRTYVSLTLVVATVSDGDGISDVTLRITAPSAFGVRGVRGIEWEELASDSVSADPWREDSTDEIDPAQLAAMRALAAALASGRFRFARRTAGLHAAPSHVWDFLRRAVDAGVTLAPHPSLDVHHVELVDPVAPGVRVSAGPDGGVTLHPSVTLRTPQRGSASATVLGEQPHGVAVFGVNTLFLAGFETVDPFVCELLRARQITVPRRDLGEFTSTYLPKMRARVAVRRDDDESCGQVISPPIPALVVLIAPDGTARLSWTIRYRVDDAWLEFDPRLEIDRDSMRDVAAELSAWESARDALEATVGVAGRWWEQATRHEQQDVWAGGLWTERLAPLPRHITQAPSLVLARVYTLSPVEAAVLVGEVVPALRDRDDVIVEVHGDATRFRPARAAASVSFGLGGDDARTDWLDLDIDVEIDGEPVPFADVMSELTRGASHMLLPSGMYFRLDTPELQRLSELLAEARAVGELESGRVRRESMNATLWDEVLALGTVEGRLAEWRDRTTRLACAEPPTSVEVPPGVDAELRDYQRRGLEWLAFLWHNGIGGILADDMGLGKTLQTLAFIAHAGSRSPFLVVAPTSVVGNWVSEAARFVPDLPVVAVTGTRSGRSVAEAVVGARIVVTSYALFRILHDELSEIDWAGTIFDEAQFVKNPASKTHQLARRLPSPFTLAITGTPMENNLSELWALLSLTVPGLFPSSDVFRQYFRKPIEVYNDATRLSVLQRRIKPVVLRRTKAEVAADLPTKQEQTVVLPLQSEHDRLYRMRLNRERQRLLGLLDDFGRNRIAILSSLTMLRQLSLHAGLVDAGHASVPSAKLEYLARVIPELTVGGHSALVFSQFTGFLRLARERLTAEGVPVRYIDGSMSAHARASEVEQFRAGGPSVFLISLKAGGFGMNLTEADHCFVCDPWWNPASEAQAVDRAHRIGQTKPVTVVRLVSADTVEEKVVALQDRKRALFDAVIGDAEVFGSTITSTDIAQMLDG